MGPMSSILPVRREMLMLALLAAAATLAPGFAAAGNRHHITLGFGYSKLLSDDLKDDASGIDFTNAGNGVLSYRYSINETWDVSLDSRATVSMATAPATVSMATESGVDLTLTNSFFGPGVRWNAPAASQHLYAQASVFLVSENFEAEQGGVKIGSSHNSVITGRSRPTDCRAGCSAERS